MSGNLDNESSYKSCAKRSAVCKPLCFTVRLWERILCAMRTLPSLAAHIGRPFRATCLPKGMTKMRDKPRTFSAGKDSAGRL